MAFRARLRQTFAVKTLETIRRARYLRDRRQKDHLGAQSPPAFFYAGRRFLADQRRALRGRFCASISKAGWSKIRREWGSTGSAAWSSPSASMSWIWAFHFFRDSDSFTPDLFHKALKFLYLHGRHIEKYLSTYYSPNTHLTGEALGLYYLGTQLPFFERSGQWRKLGEDILLAELDRQVLPGRRLFRTIHLVSEIHGRFLHPFSDPQNALRR